MATRPPQRPAQSPSSAELAPILEQNIDAVLKRRRDEDRARSLQDRAADAITRFTGSMTFVYLHVIYFGGWIWWNSDLSPLPKFDDTLVVLAMAASVEAIFLSTFILITQNRMATIADKRADLDLQISLLSEHEVTRLVTLVSAMAKQMGIDEAHDPQLDPLKNDVRPEQVLDKLDRSDGGQVSDPQR